VVAINGKVIVGSAFAGGSGVVDSVSAADPSIVVGGTVANPTVETGTLDEIATLHPPAAAWSNNGKQINGVANGVLSTDVAAVGQLSPIGPSAFQQTLSAGVNLTTGSWNTTILTTPSLAIGTWLIWANICCSGGTTLGDEVWAGILENTGITSSPFPGSEGQLQNSTGGDNGQMIGILPALLVVTTAGTFNLVCATNSAGTVTIRFNQMGSPPSGGPTAITYLAGVRIV
jgi:hypothetical protein